MPKHDDFVAEPMGDKSVKALAGIGDALGKRLESKGFDKAYKLFWKFLQLKADQKAFKGWLKKEINANDLQSQGVYSCLKECYENFKDKKFILKLPNNAPGGGVPPPGCTSTDATKKSKNEEKERPENIETYIVLLQYLEPKMDEKRLRDWREISGADGKQQDADYTALKECCHRLIAEVNLCATPGDGPPDDPDRTSTDATLKSQHEAYMFLGKFLELNMDEKRFKKWLKVTRGAESEQRHAYYTCVKAWCDKFIAEEYRRAIPGDAARGEVPPPGSTLADAMLKFKRKMESVENLKAEMENLNLNQ